jgi:glycerol-3-phosphate acyltransferase PlsY
MRLRPLLRRCSGSRLSEPDASHSNDGTIPGVGQEAVGPANRTWRLLLAAALGYVLGSIPSAHLAARFAGAKLDIARTGTGNPGAYNVARQMGKKWGIAVGIADTLKGSLAAAVGRVLAGDDGCYAAASTSVLGHVFPFGRRGGRGVATSWGACLIAFPIYAPFDAGLAATLAYFRRGAPEGTRVRPAVVFTTGVFVAAASLWSWRRLPNPGGPQSGPGLFAFAAVTSTAILANWARETQPRPGQTH